jgi:hypothetical protein
LMLLVLLLAVIVPVGAVSVAFNCWWCFFMHIFLLVLFLAAFVPVLGAVAWSFCDRSRLFLLLFLEFQSQWMQRRKAIKVRVCMIFPSGFVRRFLLMNLAHQQRQRCFGASTNLVSLIC